MQDENEKHDCDNENDLENQAAQLSDRIEGIRLKDVDISKMAKSMYLRETDERMIDQLNTFSNLISKSHDIPLSRDSIKR